MQIKEDMTSLHTKYRPHTLADLIGHEKAVTTMRGMIDSGKIPSAILITGPTSVGKTTLARAFACDLNNDPNFLSTPDYTEINVGDNRGIDDIRELQNLAHYVPMSGKKRVIVLDEVQALVGPALQCALKAIEEPSQSTLWILCSMEPEKFTTGAHRALANRCTQFNLEAPSPKDLYRQAVRICKGEGMDYMFVEDKSLLKAVVYGCNREMRTLAQILQSCQGYYEGLDEKPETLSIEDLQNVLQGADLANEDVASKYLLAIYSGKFTDAVKAVLDVDDGVAFVNTIMRLNNYLLYTMCLAGARHHKVWPTSQAKKLYAEVKKLKRDIGYFAFTNLKLVELKSKLMSFQVDPESLLTATAYDIISELFEG